MLGRAGLLRCAQASRASLVSGPAAPRRAAHSAVSAGRQQHGHRGAGVLAATASVSAFAACGAAWLSASREPSTAHAAAASDAAKGSKAADAANYKGVFDGGLGFGKKAAVVVVDFVNAYVDPSSKLYCPEPEIGVVDAVKETVPLLELARQKGVDIIFTRVLYHKHGKDGGVFVQKIPILRTFTEDNPMTELVPEMGFDEEKGDTVLIKQYPSAFFATELASMLHARGVDTVILTGCSTSGCIRATALDACSHGYRCIVPRQCVGDRTRSVHESNLFDINAKNGDVVDKSVVMEWLKQQPDA